MKTISKANVISASCKKIVVSVVSLVVILNSALAQSNTIYSNTVTDAFGAQHPLQTFQGKKIWFVILPTTQTYSDSSFLRRIDSIASAYAGVVQTIAVPSNEGGYVGDSNNTLMKWYRASLDTNVIVSAPLYTHISSGSQQDQTFSWLTHAVQNGHYDTDDGGPGSMFFINTQGNLIGVFGPVTMLNDQYLKLMLP